MAAANHQRGMTLLELLIALSIFSLIGVASYRVLSSVLDAQEIGDRHSEQLRTLQRALWIVQQDMEQLIDRPVRLHDDKTVAALVVGNEEFPLLLTRGGVRNPLQLPRSHLQRVAYSVGPHPQHEEEGSRYYKDGTIYLLRWTWDQLDGSGVNSAARVQPLLAGITESQFVAIADGQPQKIWPPDPLPATPPKLQHIELTFSSEALGEIKRLYRVDCRCLLQ